MMGLDEDITSDTSTIPEVLAGSACENPEEANLYCFDDTIVKKEVIIMPDDMLPTVQCRLCGSSDHLCSPIYNLRGGVELTEKHLETIYRLSDIIITFEKDHSSVVCTYCLLKLEEYNAIREIWQMKNKTVDDSIVPAKMQHHTIIACTAETCMKDASTQTSDCETVRNATDVRDASTCTESISEQAAPTPEHNISAKDDGDKDISTQSETIDVEEYDRCLRRKRKKRRNKKQLIEEVMHLVKKQFRWEAEETNHLIS